MGKRKERNSEGKMHSIVWKSPYQLSLSKPAIKAIKVAQRLVVMVNQVSGLEDYKADGSSQNHNQDT